MTTDPSMWNFIINASWVVKVVMMLLAGLSVISWTFIFQRGSYLKRARRAAEDFENQFWSGGELSKLYMKLDQEEQTSKGLPNIFYAGFKEFNRLRQQIGMQPNAIMEGAQRAMRVAFAKESDKLEQHLTFFATVGSTCPFIGLFGTVWGIMTVLTALGAVQQATISMVAPGISEALITTAMGLFAAIPAYIAYNRYSNAAEKLANYYHTFQEEFLSILHRQIHGQK